MDRTDGEMRGSWNVKGEGQGLGVQAKGKERKQMNNKETKDFIKKARKIAKPFRVTRSSGSISL
jgi:hypothetical protein